MLLAKADGVKFEPDLKGQSKNVRKSIIDMDYQEAQIINDAVESGMSALTAWLLVNDHREVEELPPLCISAVGFCITKLKYLVEKVKNEKQGSLYIKAPTCKARFLWCLKFSLRLNITTVRDVQNILVENSKIKRKEVKLLKDFDPANLTNLFVDQIVTRYEVNKKVIAGSDDGYVHSTYKDHIMHLTRDVNGKLEVSNGKYSREEVTLKNWKFTD